MVLQLWTPAFGTESHQSHLNPLYDSSANISNEDRAARVTRTGESMNSASFVKASPVSGWRFSRLCYGLCAQTKPCYSHWRQMVVEGKSFKMCFCDELKMFLIGKQDCSSKPFSVIKVNCRKEFIWLTSLPSWMSWIYTARTKRTMPQFVRKDQTSPNQTWALAKTEANWMEIELTCYLLYLLSWGTRHWTGQRVAMRVSVQGHSDKNFSFL